MEVHSASILVKLPNKAAKVPQRMPKKNQEPVKSHFS